VVMLKVVMFCCTVTLRLGGWGGRGDFDDTCKMRCRRVEDMESVYKCSLDPWLQNDMRTLPFYPLLPLPKTPSITLHIISQ
jgi:hypothetical protein